MCPPAVEKILSHGTEVSGMTIQHWASFYSRGYWEDFYLHQSVAESVSRMGIFFLYLAISWSICYINDWVMNSPTPVIRTPDPNKSSNAFCLGFGSTNWQLIKVVGSILHASYFVSRTCRSSLNPRFSTTVYSLRLRYATMNLPIWFVMAVDRGELNGIFCLTCNVSFKVCCFATGWISGLLSLSDRRADENKTHQSEDEVDKYSVVVLDHGCSILRVILRSYKSCRQFYFNFFSTPSCVCYRVAEMFPNKWFIQFWRLRQIDEKLSFHAMLTGFDLG